MRIKSDLRVRERPHMIGGILHISLSSGTSVQYVDTEDFAAVDYMLEDGEIIWYFFLNGRRVKWDRLTDTQRLTVRSSVADYCLRSGAGQSMYNPGEYTDDRYYTLEALS